MRPEERSRRSLRSNSSFSSRHPSHHPPALLGEPGALQEAARQIAIHDEAVPVDLCRERMKLVEHEPTNSFLSNIMRYDHVADTDGLILDLDGHHGDEITDELAK